MISCYSEREHSSSKFVLMIHGEEEVKPGLTKFPGKLQGLVMSKAGLVAAANWLLGPLSFKKQIHGMDCNGNG